MVVIETRLDQNMTKAATKIALKKALPVLIIFSAVMIGLGLLLINTDSFEFGIFCIMFGAIFVPILLLSSRSAAKKSAQSMHILSNETKEVWTIDEHNINIHTTNGADFDSNVTAKYSYLFQAVETKDAFALYISNNQMHIIPKSSIILEGSFDELRNYLKLNLGDKFKSKF